MLVVEQTSPVRPPHTSTVFKAMSRSERKKFKVASNQNQRRKDTRSNPLGI
jgi:hypothetical protein